MYMLCKQKQVKVRFISQPSSKSDICLSLVLYTHHVAQNGGWRNVSFTALSSFADIYVSLVSYTHQVAAKGWFIAMVSTTVETDNPEAEIAPGLNLLGPIKQKWVMEACHREREKLIYCVLWIAEYYDRNFNLIMLLEVSDEWRLFLVSTPRICQAEWSDNLSSEWEKSFSYPSSLVESKVR